MKVVILAGGFGTRISEESKFRPKPMIEIGGKPILWHILKGYSAYGFNDFIICLGYKGHIIKEYFFNYYLHNSDMTINLKDNTHTVHNIGSEDWKITLIDTGLNTMTGGRIKRINKYVGNDDFMITYGDGLSDVDIPKLIDFHKASGKIATLTAVKNESRFGIIDIDNNNSVVDFREKSIRDSEWINGGFMVLKPEVFDYIDGDKTVFEKEPLERLSKNNQLSAYKHDGYWQCMDTERDKNVLEELWIAEKAPWRIWK